MPAKRRKKNAQFGRERKIGAEWRWYGKKTSTKRYKTQVVGSRPPPIWVLWCASDQTRIEVPVISFGFSSPINISMVGATSASTPPLRTLKLRLPT